MRIVFAVCAALLCATGVWAAPKDLRSTDVEAAADFLADSAFPAVDTAVCVPLYKDAISVISAHNGDADAVNKALRAKHCLDKHSGIEPAYPIPDLTVEGIRLGNFESFGTDPPPAAFVSDTMPLPRLRPVHGGGMPYYGDYAYLRIDAFDEQNLPYYESDLEQMLKHRPAGIILDLRDNPGGRVTFAGQVLGAFAPKAGITAVTYEYRQGVGPFLVMKAPGSLAGLPVAILVNKNSASASEMVSSVLRRWFPQSVRLIGSRTYGKGTMQMTNPAWEQTLGVDLKITDARYYPGPDTAILIDGIGLKPDIRGGSDDLQLAISTLDRLRKKPASVVAQK